MVVLQCRKKSLCAIWRSNYSKKLFWAKKFLMARNRLTLAALTQQYTHHLITKYQYYYHSKPYYITAPSCLAFLYEIWFKGNSVIPDHWPLTFLVSFLTSSLTIKKVSSLTSSLTFKKMSSLTSPLIYRSFFAHFPLILSDVFRQFFKNSNAPVFALMT